MKKIIALFMLTLLLFLFNGCGNNEVNTITCNNCGEVISETSTYCEKCGVKVADDLSEQESSIKEDESNSIEIESTTDNNENITENTQSKKRPTEVPKPTEKPTEAQKPAKNQTTEHTHSYSKKVQVATCTEKGYTTYVCDCGHTYKDDYVNPSHTFVNNICSQCGQVNESYNLYQSEYTQLTNQYNADIAELQNKLTTSEDNYAKYKKAYYDALDSLQSYQSSNTASPPAWFIKQYVDIWQVYGSEEEAKKAAESDWRKQYNNQCEQYRKTMDINGRNFQIEAKNITKYKNAISERTTQYNNDVSALKEKYGVK